MTLGMDGYIRSERYKDYVPRARIVMLFENGKENRRLPLVVTNESVDDGVFTFSGRYRYMLDELFWRTRENTQKITLKFEIYFGEEFEECAEVDFSTAVVEKVNPYYEYTLNGREVLLLHKPVKTLHLPKAVRTILYLIRMVGAFAIGIALIPWCVIEVLFSFLGAGGLDSTVTRKSYIQRIKGQIIVRFENLSLLNIDKAWLKRTMLTTVFFFCRWKKTQKNKIAFISARDDKMSLNFSLVYEALKEKNKYDLVFQSFTRPIEAMRLGEMVSLCKTLTTSKVAILEEFTPAMSRINMKKGSSLIQLWHAAGAFKTGGYARLGKPGSPSQRATTHRNYDYATVSSTYAKYCHAEGFGLSDYSVVPTGVARTDIFFDESYKARKREEFYSKYPALAGKKIVVFAPTFRGMDKSDAYYPFDRFNAGEVVECLGGDYAVIIKHHPFIAKKHPIPDSCSNAVIDLTEGYDINDLLFVADVVITDYSSLIFEASLLNIPMLFYVFDYTEYIRDRDFYFDLKLMAPGKLVYSQDEIIASIQNSDYRMDNMNTFKKWFFDDLDGRSTERIVGLIEESVADGGR